jgi:sialic acid synthase SpsE
MKPYIEIGKRSIGQDFPPLIIPEIGINHGGHFDRAIEMINDCKAAGAEIVKFQCHIADEEMIPSCKIYDVIKRCQFTESQETALKQYTEAQGMMYISTPFSFAAVDRLEQMGVIAYKIGSGECNNIPLVKYIASKHKPIILSTGMNSISEAARAWDIIESAGCPIAILHCVSMYPTPYNKVNLTRMEQFEDAVYGYSDHSSGIIASLAAVARGASIIEKHFISSNMWDSPDLEVSIDFKELYQLIRKSDQIHRCLQLSEPEDKTIQEFAFSSVVALRDISVGELFTSMNIGVKRPGGGIPAKYLDNVLGRLAARNFKKDEQINV